jgi:hypothetical protein
MCQVYRILDTGLEACCFTPFVYAKSEMFSSFVSHLLPFIISFSLFVSSSSRDSEVGVASKLRIGRPGIGIPERAKDFSVLQNVHTGFGAHATFSSMGTGIKWLRSDVDYSWPPTAEFENVWGYTFNSPMCFHGLYKKIILFFACYFYPLNFRRSTIGISDKCVK